MCKLDLQKARAKLNRAEMEVHKVTDEGWVTLGECIPVRLA